MSWLPGFSWFPGPLRCVAQNPRIPDTCMQRICTSYSLCFIFQCASPSDPTESWKIPDPMEFQSWKVNSRTEVCLRTVDLQTTVLWIKEVEIAKSIDELVTSRSIVGRTDFPDYDMLDAMVASALQSRWRCRKKRGAISGHPSTLPKVRNCRTCDT